METMTRVRLVITTTKLLQNWSPMPDDSTDLLNHDLLEQKLFEAKRLAKPAQGRTGLHGVREFGIPGRPSRPPREVLKYLRVLRAKVFSRHMNNTKQGRGRSSLPAG
jgi:hypothetical protein